MRKILVSLAMGLMAVSAYAADDSDSYCIAGGDFIFVEGRVANCVNSRGAFKEKLPNAPLRIVTWSQDEGRALFLREMQERGYEQIAEIGVVSYSHPGVHHGRYGILRKQVTPNGSRPRFCIDRRYLSDNLNAPEDPNLGLNCTEGVMLEVDGTRKWSVRQTMEHNQFKHLGAVPWRSKSFVIDLYTKQ